MILKIVILIASSVISEYTLDSRYQEYNQKYFQNELPGAIVSMDLRDDRFMGTTEYDGEHYHIRLNPKYNIAGSTINQTELHEMCHVQQMVEGKEEFEDHGPRWQSCMMNLAKQGALANLW